MSDYYGQWGAQDISYMFPESDYDRWRRMVMAQRAGYPAGGVGGPRGAYGAYPDIGSSATDYANLAQEKAANDARSPNPDATSGQPDRQRLDQLQKIQDSIEAALSNRWGRYNQVSFTDPEEQDAYDKRQYQELGFLGQQAPAMEHYADTVSGRPEEKEAKQIELAKGRFGLERAKAMLPSEIEVAKQRAGQESATAEYMRGRNASAETRTKIEMAAKVFIGLIQEMRVHPSKELEQHIDLFRKGIMKATGIDLMEAMGNSGGANTGVQPGGDAQSLLHEMGFD